MYSCGPRTLARLTGVFYSEGSFFWRESNCAHLSPSVPERGFCYNHHRTARVSLLGARCFYTAVGAAFQTCNQPSPYLGPDTPIGPVKPDHTARVRGM